MKARKHQVEANFEISQNSEGIIHLPTGTGKSFIQAMSINDNLSSIRVFVVLAPRILLTNQLYNDIKKYLVVNNNDCQYLIVHSGKAADKTDFKWVDLPYREVNSTTSSVVIREQYERTQRENVPLVIFGTYDSAERITQSGIPVYMLLCDEAHYLVSEEFSWIRYEKYTDGRKQFNAERKYYFTATLKNTTSDYGLGMNNSDEFGNIIYTKTPLDMIVAGEILRPRLHLVDVNGYSMTDELDIDAHSIIESYIEHRIHCKVGAKILVVTKGTEHLNNLVNHPRILEELDTRPNLQIFDISSEYKPRINGIVVSREEFLRRLQGLTDADDALIFHVRILTEGIDVPGITGVLIMNQLSLSVFLQTTGRATRLHVTDRKKLYAGQLTSDTSDLSRYVKPYAWIIVPIYGIIGDDMKDRIRDIIYALRSFGFNAAEDCVIKQSRGKALSVPIGQLNELDTRGQMYKQIIYDIEHDVETREVADKMMIDDFKLSLNIRAEDIDTNITNLVGL